MREKEGGGWEAREDREISLGVKGGDGEGGEGCGGKRGKEGREGRKGTNADYDVIEKMLCERFSSEICNLCTMN